MILSKDATSKDYNTVAQSLINDCKRWELILNEELYKMVYMQLYNRIRRESMANQLRVIIFKMDALGIW